MGPRGRRDRAHIQARDRPPPPAAPDRPAIARRLSTREFIHCDLHMHTDHSPDCATPVDVLLETAKQRGLGAIAITDHNEISGALEARERAKGIKVIVSEEVKTALEGEVIGLFIEEKIPRGMTLKETIDAIHAQGGLAYVPHPFDRLHAIPDYEHLLKVVGDIDILEVFNARVAVRGFNEEAQRFADKYRLVAGAGSDSHVAQGLGTVKIRMRAFDGARGVPGEPAGRRHPAQAKEPDLPAVTEVPADGRRPCRGRGDARARTDARRGVLPLAAD